MVLVWLRSNAPDELEFAVDIEDALEGWRLLKSVVCVCRRGWRYDMVLCEFVS